MYSRWKYMLTNSYIHKTGVINDPLGQTHSSKSRSINNTINICKGKSSQNFQLCTIMLFH